jgi:hypothetical protein
VSASPIREGARTVFQQRPPFGEVGSLSDSTQAKGREEFPNV